MKLKAFRPFFSECRAWYVLLACTWPTLSLAQSPEWARVVAAHESLSLAQTEEDRLALHGQLEALWPQALAAGHAFTTDWTTWRNAVVDLGEGGNRLIVFTWNVELDDRTQRYGGWVAHAAPESSLGYEFTMLNHDPKVDPSDVGRMHRHDQWQGGLYYNGVLNFDRQKPVYTMLAWDGADALTTRKWVETVEPRNGRVRFGSPRFNSDKGLQKRVVLNYADAVQATLRVSDNPEQIVFDHLAPEDPSFKGQHAFYGPTLSYDALEWRKGRWHLVRDIAVQNDDGNSPKEYRDPTQRHRRN